MGWPRPSLAELDSVVRSFFVVESWSLEGEVPVYVVRPSRGAEEDFRGLYSALRGLGLTPILRREGERLVLRVVALRRRAWPGGRALAALLFLATLGTILAAGYVVTVLDPLIGALDESVAANPAPHLLGYALSMIGIVGVHELGHKLACRAHGIRASPPYFIPFPPLPALPIGTLGAVILQEEPPLTRNQLFDLGLSGPIFGFLASMVVTAVGLRLSYPLSVQMVERILSEGGGVLPTPLVYRLLVPLLRPDLGEAAAIYLHPIAWAGWVGLLVTFLNSSPIGQLDGGHTFRALLSERAHLALSFAFVAFLLIEGFWAMAVLAALLALRRHPGALNEATPLSPSRRLGAAALLLVWLASLPVPPWL
ncbi:MAG: site-2 protease family protein [Candidatus Nezhaarchaeales archaeon]